VIRRAGVFLCHGRIEGTSAAHQNRREPALLLAASLTSWHERVRRLAMLALYGGQQFCDQGGQLLGFDLESFQFPAQPFQPLDRSGGRGTTTWHRGSSHCEPVPSILQAGQSAFSRPGPLYSAELPQYQVKRDDATVTAASTMLRGARRWNRCVSARGQPGPTVRPAIKSWRILVSGHEAALWHGRCAGSADCRCDTCDGSAISRSPPSRSQCPLD
jgi:hypothetical protein